MAPSLVVATQLISHTLPLLINASQEKRPPTSSYVVYVTGLGPFPEKGSECLAGGQGGSGHEKRENLWPRWALGPSCPNSPRGERPHPGRSTDPGCSPVPQATGTEVAPRALESRPPGTAPAPPTVPDRAAQLGRPRQRATCSVSSAGPESGGEGARAARGTVLRRGKARCPRPRLPPFLPWTPPGCYPGGLSPQTHRRPPPNNRGTSNRGVQAKGWAPHCP